MGMAIEWVREHSTTVVLTVLLLSLLLVGYNWWMNNVGVPA